MAAVSLQNRLRTPQKLKSLTPVCRAPVTTFAPLGCRQRPASHMISGSPCLLRRSARPRSSARSSKPRPSLSAKPWSSPTERPGRWRTSGSTNCTAFESRSGATMESGRFQRLNSRRARPSDKASLVILRRFTLCCVPRSGIAQPYSLHFASLRRGYGNTFAARWDRVATRIWHEKNPAERDLDVAP